MPFKVDFFPQRSLVMVDVYGVIDIDNRRDVLDRQLFAIKKYDIRQCITDLSMLSPENNELDELFFAEEMRSHSDVLTRLHQTVIHPTQFGGTNITARFLEREGVPITDRSLAEVRQLPIHKFRKF